MNHTRGIGNDLTYYYKGQSKEGYNYFGFQKRAAKRFDKKEEAILAMTILEAMDLCASDTFSVLPVKCRI
jgi:hypothetical protein